MQSEPTKAELAKLRALAEIAAATAPDVDTAWFADASHEVLADMYPEDAEFVVAANPATIIALIDAIEARDKRISEIEAQQAWAWQMKRRCELPGCESPLWVHIADAHAFTAHAPSEAQ